MAKNRATIHDIAKELNITASTVSRALKGNPSISESTRQAVIDMAQKMHYKPNHLAAALRSGRSYIIGIIVPAADRSFFAKVIRGVEDELGPAGYSVLVCQTYEAYDKERHILETLLRSRADGIIASIAKNTLSYEHFQRATQEGVSIILFDRAVDELKVPSVTIDDYLGARMAVEHLIEQGCRRIAHLAGPQHIDLYRMRFRGYLAALEFKGIPFDPGLVIPCESQVDLGKNAAEKLMSLPNPPDAIFSSSDFAALGAMQYCKSRQLSIPGQVAIVGFANEPFTSFVEPALSTVDQNSYEMGRIAAQLFLEEMEPAVQNPPRQVVLRPQLIVRASSQKKA